MHVKKCKMTHTNKFGDSYEVEYEQWVFDSDDEKRKAQDFKRKHGTLYSQYQLEKSSGIPRSEMDQIMESIEEYMDMMENLK